MKNLYSRTTAFTIIELLVVIGIISILAITLLVSLNPAEAQRRARDAQRLKDMNTLQAIIEQYSNDGYSLSGCAAGTPCNSATVTGTSPNVCGVANWMGLNFCVVARTVPTDPANNSTRTCITGSGTTTQAGCKMRYRAIFSGNAYEVSTMLESTINAGKAGGDGGNVGSLFQLFSSTELTLPAFTVGGATSAAS